MKRVISIVLVLALLISMGAAFADSAYQAIGPFSEGLAAVKQNNKWGFVDKSGAPVTECIYTSVGQFVNGFAKVQLDGKWGYINTAGEIIIPCEYEEPGKQISAKDRAVSDFSEGYVRVISGGLYGFADTNGTIVVPCKYTSAEDFKNGCANVTGDNKDGVLILRESGEIEEYFGYDGAQHIGEGIIEVRDNSGNYGMVNKDGETVLPVDYDSTWFFENGYCRVEKNEKFGMVNSAGDLVISCKYKSLSVSGEGYFAARKDKKLGLIDAGGNALIPFEYEAIGTLSEDLVPARKDGKYGYLNLQNEWVIPNEYEDARQFVNGAAAVKKDGEILIINAKNEVILKGYSGDAALFPMAYYEGYQYPELFSADGIAGVEKDGKWGFIDTCGDTIVPFEYDMVNYNDGWFTLLRDGAITIGEVKDICPEYDEKLAAIEAE
ncbi:MAG: WG repeat-containing protein, partial [Clostridia bacterium]|nr:WG repeat-containing protein [Clostridia bacterium]